MRSESGIGNQPVVNFLPRPDAIFTRREILDAELAVLIRAGLTKEQSLRGGFSRRRTQSYLNIADSFALIVMDRAGNIRGVGRKLNFDDAAHARGEIENSVSDVLVSETDGLDVGPVRRTIHVGA